MRDDDQEDINRQREIFVDSIRAEVEGAHSNSLSEGAQVNVNVGESGGKTKDAWTMRAICLVLATGGAGIGVGIDHAIVTREPQAQAMSHPALERMADKIDQINERFRQKDLSEVKRDVAIDLRLDKLDAGLKTLSGRFDDETFAALRTIARRKR